MAPEPPYTHGSPSKTGVLLVNLGTPDAPTAAAVKVYLKQFLSDPRVVEIPRLVWWLILNGIILNTRPKQSAEKYALVWTQDGSPLRFHTERQAKLVLGLMGEQLKTKGLAIPLVDYAMRYGNPSIASVMQGMKRQGCERILVLPLYPQYAASTTASTFDAVFAELGKMRNVPAIRTIKHYHDDPRYIAALAKNVRDYWQKNGRAELLVMSFHGLPRFSLDKGDPYHCECHKTGRLLAEALGLSQAQYRVTFQSRFGKAEWLKPYTAATLAELGQQKPSSQKPLRVDVVCPGFVADCLETLEEIAIEGKATFIAAGGGEFNYIPCLNEREDWIATLTEIALENLGGWLNAEKSTEELAQSRQRATALGAAR